MTRVQQIQHETKSLTHRELSAFRKWFQKFDSAEWDKQIEADALSGKLDNLAKKALADHKAGRTKEI